MLNKIRYMFVALCALGALAPSAQAANLVVNSGFETLTSCPIGLVGSPTEFALATGWSMPTQGSPDLYNSCATSGSGVQTPVNAFGTQAPHGGAGYAGFRIFSAITSPTNPTIDYREYIQGTLTAPLVAGVVYNVGYYVSLSDVIAIAAIGNIDLHFSIGALGPVATDQVLSLTPQVVNTGGPISDKLNWTLISGTYLAVGGETNFTIGNFNSDLTTNRLALTGSFCCTYYFLDDVSVEARTGGTVPEPSTLALLAGLALWYRRRGNTKAATELE